jgi:hypothetical protein
VRSPFAQTARSGRFRDARRSRGSAFAGELGAERSRRCAGEFASIFELYRDDVALSEGTQCPAGVGDQAVLEAGRNEVEMGDVGTAPPTAASHYSLQEAPAA